VHPPKPFGTWAAAGRISESEEEMAAAGNEWINGYLEAILDAGARRRGERGAPALTTPRLLLQAPAPALAEAAAAAYSPTRYFVEEVVSHFDDRDLHRTWTKVVHRPSSFGRRRSGTRA